MNSNGRAPGALPRLDTIGGDRGAPGQTQTRAYPHQGKVDLSAGGDPAYTTVSCSEGRSRRWATQTSVWNITPNAEFLFGRQTGSSLDVRNVLIVLNERAGSLLDRDPLAVKAELRRRLAGPGRTVDVLLAHGRSIGRAIDRGAASDYDTIIVGGGDGSVGHAAHRLAGTDKALGVLPLGTVNLLARDIGVPADLDDAIAAVEEFVPRAIDLGMLNGRAFHTLSGMGFFSQMARAREETRDLPGKALRVMAAAARAFRRAGRFKLDISIDGRTRP